MPSELYLDPANPRLADEEFSFNNQEKILRWLWRNKSVNELVDSILANGFWEHEELFAAEEDGRLVVVEGNRRLAAVKILSDPDLREKLRIQLANEPSESVVESIRELPVIHATRRDLWGFIGSSMSTDRRPGIPSPRQSMCSACDETSAGVWPRSHQGSETVTRP